MAQEVEIEFKNMLTKEEYASLLDSYKLEENIKTQTNDYFDTKNFMIREKGAALRIRNKNDKFVLTLKQPAEEGLLETHQAVSQEIFEEIKKDGTLPDGEVASQLNELGIPSPLHHLGRLTTHRAEYQTTEGLLVLDHSEYLGREDFELEFEVSDFTTGERAFASLLHQHQIPKRKTNNKILRFFLASQEQD
ncbi:CYTH domain-containing protein [Guptibacillus hwajinpoensis]|uniref:CYTH domain-containing protein n=1 Tax=Guptibacillus hwajinpoensis TaxID=208199 RepID=UPI00273FA3D3|nr:CYTH domain-containing protein [Pseudalkalibacillus hwajinpoensis]WLR59533.1 CYTH domain-containing protein [Pseudalkalibacillus hwajinpoensis]